MDCTGGGGISGNKVSNVTITITDNASVVEGEVVIATCNGKTFESTVKRGVAKLYTTEVGTYTISAGEYSTMLVCPYYGQFSTDIYSGVLKVVCTEVGGNNKTCHVQSCDDEYNFTSAYNLTQTFDNSLGLTFMGIPTGKYLITVDDRYRFYKEITSIQNVNQIEVELKQWLFNNGDQCPWNTGGWMQCQATGSTYIAYVWTGSAIPSAASHAEHFELTDMALRITQRVMATEIYRYTSSRVYEYARSEATSNLYIGTKKYFPINPSKYNKLICTASSEIIITLRSGSLNNSSTNTSTATVLVSGTGNSININTADVNSTIVIGSIYSSPKGYGTDSSGSYGYNGGYQKSPQGSIDSTQNTDITEVYLV